MQRRTKFASAVGARADGAKVIEAVDPGGMAVTKGDLNGVAADGGGRLRARLGLEHRENSARGNSGCAGRSHRAGHSFFFAAFVVAERAGAEVAQVDEVVMAGVPVGPDDVHTRARGDVNLNAGGFSARVNGYGHGDIGCRPDVSIIPGNPNPDPRHPSGKMRA